MLKKIIIAVLLLGAIGVGTGIYMWNKKPETVDNKKGVAITATDLAAAYTANEETANTQYLNKVIEVNGIIGETEQNQDGGSMIILQTGDPMAEVQCAMREKGVTVAKGASVTIKGFCSGSGMTGVSLTDCIIVK